MKFNRVIEIDIWSSFGCFNKPFSTSGGNLSYLIPPKTAIIGMIGSVLGYNINNFEEIDNNTKRFEIERLNDIKVSIQPLFDFKSKRVTFNQVHVESKKIKIKNFHQDILINPYYKIFISFPDFLEDIEKEFIKKIKNNESVYNLYMGKNEFILNYSLCNIFSYESIFLNENNVKDFDNNLKIYGILNRELIHDVKLSKISYGEDSYIFGPDITRLPSFYEYIINEYPIKRTNFNDFNFISISFFFSKNFGDCYFSKIIFKENNAKNRSLELTKIGEDEWISMI